MKDAWGEAEEQSGINLSSVPAILCDDFFVKHPHQRIQSWLCKWLKFWLDDYVRKHGSCFYSHKTQAKTAFNRRNRFSVLDFHGKIGMPPAQTGSCCACTVSTSAQHLWCSAMGFPSPRHIACNKRLKGWHLETYFCKTRLMSNSRGIVFEMLEVGRNYELILLIYFASLA